MGWLWVQGTKCLSYNECQMRARGPLGMEDIVQDQLLVVRGAAFDLTEGLSLTLTFKKLMA